MRICLVFVIFWIFQFVGNIWKLKNTHTNIAFFLKSRRILAAGGGIHAGEQLSGRKRQVPHLNGQPLLARDPNWPVCYLPRSGWHCVCNLLCERVATEWQSMTCRPALTCVWCSTTIITRAPSASPILSPKCAGVYHEFYAPQRCFKLCAGPTRADMTITQAFTFTLGLPWQLRVRVRDRSILCSSVIHSERGSFSPNLIEVFCSIYHYLTNL